LIFASIRRRSHRPPLTAEATLAAFARANAAIDGVGIGTSLTTSADVPNLDCVYKMQEYAGLARRKRSAKKATWPPQTGVAALRRRRPHGRRRARARGSRALAPDRFKNLWKD
jgi:nicotinic acid phosphoribosyltransferase